MLLSGDAAQQCASLVDLLELRMDRQPNALAYRFLVSGDVDGPILEWTYRDLYFRVHTLASRLQEMHSVNECVLLLYPTGLEFIAAFLGCICAGAIPVPAYPHRSLSRLESIVRDSRARFVLTTASFLKFSAELKLQAPELSEAVWFATDEFMTETPTRSCRPDVRADALAFLQYTSGSTGDPKGVMVSHGNLLHNQSLIAKAFAVDSSSHIVGWQPLYHDMGLIGNVLQTLYAGASCTLMSPVSFQQQPMRWLQAITRFHGTISGGPNFAFDLCVRSKKPDVALDLSSWKVAFNGSEPIRQKTMEQFTAAFSSCGFSPDAFHPCYGLAEATLFVAGRAGSASQTILSEALERGHAQETLPGETAEKKVIVSCGRSQPGQRIVIAKPETRMPCPDGIIGEVWVSGPSVTCGYWSRPEESHRVFRAQLASGNEGTFLRTGDLGFMVNGELFLTGRLKDIIIIRGRNLFPQDIEFTMERIHSAIRRGGCAAFSIEKDGDEKLVVAAEINQKDAASAASIVDAIRRGVTEEHGIQSHIVVLLKKHSIPKTSSGKIRRSACRKNLLAGVLPTLVVSELGTPDCPDSAATPVDPVGVAPANVVEHRIAGIWAEVLGLDHVGLQDDFFALGGDSLRLMQMGTRIQESFGIDLPPRLLFSSATVAGLAAIVEQMGVAKDCAERNDGKDGTITRLQRTPAILPNGKSSPASGQ